MFAIPFSAPWAPTPASARLTALPPPGLWPLRTADEQTEVCKVFNLPHDVVEKYVQFGERSRLVVARFVADAALPLSGNTFNLLHVSVFFLNSETQGSFS